MKHLSLRWLAAALLSPVLLVMGILLFGAQPQAASSGGKGIVQVAFTGTLVNANSGGGPPLSIAQSYQRVLLNVLSVRLNPSANLSISNADPHWVTIAAPAKIGLFNPVEFISTSLNFGGTLGGAPLTAATSVLQLDLTALQNLPFFFNAGSVTAATYKQAELVLNPKLGTVVPLCPNALPAGEGCIPYGIKLASGTATRLRAQFINAAGTVAGFQVAAGSVQPLVINIAATVGPGPTSSSKTMVAVAPVITPCSGTNVCPANGVINGVPYNPALGIVTGTIDTAVPGKTTVTAELSGTDEIVATTRLASRDCTPTGTGDVESCTFSLNLPAQTTPNSTLYDFYVAGGGAYVVRSGFPVSAQGSASTPPPNDLGTLSSAPSGFGTIHGAIFDACVGITRPVQAATLELLVPDTSVGGSTCDLTGSPPALPSNCVVVATAATDELGLYPQPVSNHTSQPFNKIPFVLPPGVDHYDLEINATGFNTTVQEVASPGGRVLNCPTAGFSGADCSFLLEHGFISGTTTLSSPNASGGALNVLVMGEDSGTNTIENLVSSTIPPGAASGSFSLAVPDAAPSSGIPPAASVGVPDYDVFSTVQDFFGTALIKNSGHLIGTAASVGAPAACSTITISPLSPMDCVGLGSVAGSVSGANPNTTSVRLSKDGVQIQQTEPNSIGFDSSPNGSFYNFCAPADAYDLVRFEGTGDALVPPVELSSAPVALATPITIPTPCTSVCGGTAGGCKLCQPTTGPVL